MQVGALVQQLQQMEVDTTAQRQGHEANIAHYAAQVCPTVSRKTNKTHTHTHPRTKENAFHTLLQLRPRMRHRTCLEGPRATPGNFQIC